ncbi:helix-turn-helix domain-containing protein [Cryptosporangium phraense]|uniref:helix-turn-helix domain-containing protein n=1 Tax=Cryptosporangium phraense TaxID=2593070 RepID=UPI0014783E18|nr:helix-turn-helix transcriptional regulator [Cryptosporangium phraense]
MTISGGVARGRGRRRLLRELTRLRVEARLSLDEAAMQLLGKSGSALYRMEAGQVAKIRPLEVRALCAGYGASPELTADLADLAEETTKASKGWWGAVGSPAAPWFTTLLSLEDEAQRIDAWCPTLILGLLQTEDYARAVMTAFLGLNDPAEIERQLTTRMKRQAVLTRRAGAVEVWAVLDESVLHRVMGSQAVMRDQLRHLVAVSERPNVTLQVVPFSAGGHPVLSGGPIVLFSFRDPTDPGVVYLENHAGALHLEEPSDVVIYARMVEHGRTSALSASDSRERIAALAAALD